MIRKITARELDSTDDHIVRILHKHRNGCKIGHIVEGTDKSEGSVRYRLLTLEACGIVRAARERGSTTYFLNIPEQSI
jgi:DNA-binding transcriptional ArsR family regulator